MKSVPYISDEYLEIQMEHHRKHASWGCGGTEHASFVMRLAEILGTKSVLDYGCGKGAFAKAMSFPIREYDPAISGKDTPPEKPADIVHCNQVLQHVEPRFLESILRRLNELSTLVCLIYIKWVESHTVYEDGRNATLTPWPPDKWTSEIGGFFPNRLLLVEGIAGDAGYFSVMAITKGVFERLVFK